MKAVVQEKYGSSDVLQIRDIPRPEVGDDEVLVRVAAASVDWRVWHLATGTPYVMRLAGVGLRAPKVSVPRSDVGGRVEAVGKDVTRFAPGDEVYGTCDGAYAEYASAREDKLAPKPPRLSFEQAAAVPFGGFPSLQGLRDHGHLQPGQKVLIVGAAGAVGTIAVQLAKAFGGEVTGVCGTSKMDLVRGLGADNVIDYTREDFADGRQRYDLILDIAGNSAVSRLRRALTGKGTLLIIGGESGRRILGIGRQIRAHLLSPFVGQKLGTFIAKENATDLLALNELIEAGKLAPVIDRTFPLSEAPEALRQLESGQAPGRLVLVV